jgi:hypothetical protein
MAAEMPSLQNIAILSTLGRWVGGCGNAMERDFDYSQKRIGEILEAFGRARGSPALTSLIETHWRRIKGIDGRIKGINGWARLFNTKPMYGSLKYEY